MRTPFLILFSLLISLNASAELKLTCKDVTGTGPWTKFTILLPDLTELDQYFPWNISGKLDAKVTVIGNFKGFFAIEKYDGSLDEPEIWIGKTPSWNLKITKQEDKIIEGSSEILSDYGSFDMNIGMGEGHAISILANYGSDSGSARGFYTCK